VVSGLSPRFGTKHIADLGITVDEGAVANLIDRGDGYRYLVVITPGDLKVFDMNGVEETVTFPNGKSYLTVGGDATNKFRFLTFEDTTFILNREMVTSEDFIGEEGSWSYTLDGTVADFASLPTAAVGYSGDVYQTSDTDYYYRCELTSGQEQIISWVLQSTVGPTSTSYSFDGWSLPATPTLGQTFVLKVRDYKDKYYYKTYEGEETQAAVSPVYGWVRVLPYQFAEFTDRLDWTKYGTVHVTNSVSNSYYNIYVNGTLKASFLTANGTSAADSVEGTDVIATELRTDLVSNGYTVTRYGSTLSIELAPGDEITITSTNGDKAMKCYRETVQSFSDLPPNEAEGRIVKVRGAPEENQDDYYVRFEDGRWIETYAFGALSSPAATSMPHILVKTGDGTWDFKQTVWGSRAAGDVASNPPPSFIGYPISDMFQYTNRIGFLTEDNIILSESNNFENYFRTTIATLLDSDPIDMAVLSHANDALRHAVPFNKDVLILGDLSQHRLTYSQLVGPKNIQINFTTSYNCSANIRPLNMGDSLYFIDDRDSYAYAKMFEYYPKQNSSADAASEVTDPIPFYIPSGVRILAASPRLSASIIGTAAAPTSLFLFKFFWSGEKKVQNAWCRWNFDDADNLLWAGFSGKFLYILIDRGGSVFLESMEISEDIPDRIILDRSVTGVDLSLSYSGGYTEFTLPYTTSVTPSCVSLTSAGQTIVHNVEHVTGDTYRVPWDLTEDESVWAGVKVTSSVTLSHPYVRVQKGGGETPTEESPLMVKDLRVSYANMQRIDATLVVRGKTFTKTISYSDTISTGNFVLPIITNNHSVDLTLGTDFPLSYQLTSAEWRGQFAPKSRRA
jgi:hypothetical protein